MTIPKCITAAVAISLATATAAPAAPPASQPAASQPAAKTAAAWDIGAKRIFARVIPTGNVTAARRLNIRVTSWTSPEERQTLLKAFVDGGSDGLLEAMDDVDKGNVQLPRTLGWDLSYAWTQPLEDGKRMIRLATERPVFLFETVNMTRSRDYEFGIIEMIVDADGNGEGHLVPAAQIHLNDDGVLEVQTRPYQHGPHRLVKVEMKDLHKEKKKK